MAIIITDECINCGACEPECPNTAIYEAAVNWKYSDGTSLSGDVNLLDGKNILSDNFISCKRLDGLLENYNQKEVKEYHI